MSETVNLDEIWAGDYLERRDEVAYLTAYLRSRYQLKPKERGFVLGVNADWGMGKSFMLNGWANQVYAEGHPVVRFDAWENDFTEAPLVAFIAELDRQLTPLFNKIPLLTKLHAQWYEQAKAVIVPSLKTIGYAAAKHGLGMGAQQISEIWEQDRHDVSNSEFDVKSLGEKLNKIAEDTLKSHNNTKNAIQAFKVKLTAITTHLANDPMVQLPIYVFIDELDRCRPDYAIELLEGIKHIFGIAGLYFVIATNMVELAHSVKSVYGSGFSADRYLKRFFDMEYTLPSPDGGKFAVELMAPIANHLPVHFVTGLDHFLTEEQKKFNSLPYIFERAATSFSLPFRDQHQVATIIEASLISLRAESVHIHLLIFLAMLYQKNSTVYHAVATALNISQGTGFVDIYPSNSGGYIRVPRYENNAMQERNSSTKDSAEFYFQLANNQRVPYRAPADHFPENLGNSFGAENPQTVVKKYIELVRRAGRFTA